MIFRALLLCSFVWVNSALAEPVAVTGQARFEKRMTLVPLVEGSVSRPYWALVLHAGPVRYEVNHIFELGAERAPESVELAGAVIRSGNHVAIEGDAMTVDRSYSFLSDITRVSVSEELNKSDDLGVPTFGWSCLGEDVSSGITVSARVYRAGNPPVPGSYKLRIDVLSGGTQPSISFDHVKFRTERETLVYEGRKPEVMAQLLITQPEDADYRNLTGSLRLTRSAVVGDVRVPIEAELLMSCTRTRLQTGR